MFVRSSIKYYDVFSVRLRFANDRTNQCNFWWISTTADETSPHSFSFKINAVLVTCMLNFPLFRDNPSIKGPSYSLWSGQLRLLETLSFRVGESKFPLETCWRGRLAYHCSRLKGAFHDFGAGSKPTTSHSISVLISKLQWFGIHCTHFMHSIIKL